MTRFICYYIYKNITLKNINLKKIIDKYYQKTIDKNTLYILYFI